MAFSRLEIVRYAPTGQVDRRIACLAGRISVFRSRSEHELELYQDALLGRNSEGKEFTLTLDESTFDPTNHDFIGFGESWNHPDPTTVEAYAARRPGGPEGIVASLSKFGFQSLLSARLADLSPLQQRVIRLICAVSSRGSVIVIREPFGQFPEELREEIGLHLAEQTWKNQLILVITSLVERPDCWLENEHITRIQLEKPRQRTIGFGSGGFGTVALVDKLRQELRAPGSSDEQLFEGIPQQDNRSRRTRSNHLTGRPEPELGAPNNAWKRFLALGLGASVLTVGLALSLTPPRQRQAHLPPPMPPTLPVVASSSPRVEQTQPAIVAPVAHTAPTVALALNEYPADIQEAVRKAFYEPMSELDQVPGFPSQPTPKPSASPEPTGQAPEPEEAPAVDYSPPEAPNEQDLEARREQLREAFRQAIMRAQQRRLMEQQQMMMPQ